VRPQLPFNCMTHWLCRLSFLSLCLLLASFSLIFLRCGNTRATPLGPSDNLVLKGQVRGGNQAVAGAEVRLYAAGSAGDGSSGTPVLSQHFHTGSNGQFDILTAYTCPTPASQVYLVAEGGRAKGYSDAPNSSIALMAYLGPCGSLSSVPFVSVNEVTTVGTLFRWLPTRDQQHRLVRQQRMQRPSTRHGRRSVN